MEWVKTVRLSRLSVSEALLFPRNERLLTSRWLRNRLAWRAPVLLEFGFHATLSAAGFLGNRVPEREQVRALDAQGFEIGCHSMTHAYLSDLSEEELRREVVDAKTRIEQIVGQRIEHLPVPRSYNNVRWRWRVRRIQNVAIANSCEWFGYNATTRPRRDAANLRVDESFPVHGVFVEKTSSAPDAPACSAAWKRLRRCARSIERTQLVTDEITFVNSRFLPCSAIYGENLIFIGQTRRPRLFSYSSAPGGHADAKPYTPVPHA